MPGVTGIAAAPCSWGVEDPGNPHNPPWLQVLDEAVSAGYRAIELGPFGYLPVDASLLNNELGKRRLSVVAGTLFEPLWDHTQLARITEKTREICQFLKTVGVGQLVVIDSVNPTRSHFAGHNDMAPRLDNQQWETMMSAIRTVADIASDHGIRTVVHPHAGSYIEYADEIFRMLDDLPHEQIGLCLDTGHCVYAGMDPVQMLKECQSRLEYIHFKDIHTEKLQRCTSTMKNYWETCQNGVMCPIGEGDIDFEAVETILDEIGYKDWITIEQNRDHQAAATTLHDAKKSLKHLLPGRVLLIPT